MAVARGVHPQGTVPARAEEPDLSTVPGMQIRGSIRATVRAIAVAALTTAVAAGGLAGCSRGGDDGAQQEVGGPEASVGVGSPTPSAPAPDAAATPSPEPSEAPAREVTEPPERPDALRTADAAGAEAAARYFAELWPYASATGDEAKLRALSAAACTTCARALEGLAAQEAAGQHTVGGAAHITWVKAFVLDSGGWTVDVDLDQEPCTVVDASGAVVPGGTPATVTNHLDFDVTHDGDGWHVQSVAVLPIAYSELPTAPPS